MTNKRIVPQPNNREKFVRHLLAEHDWDNKADEDISKLSEDQLLDFHHDFHKYTPSEDIYHKHYGETELGSPLLRHLIDHHSVNADEIFEKAFDETGSYDDHSKTIQNYMKNYHNSDHKHYNMPHVHLNDIDPDDIGPRTAHLNIPNPKSRENLIRHLRSEHGFTYPERYDPHTGMLEADHRQIHRTWVNNGEANDYALLHTHIASKIMPPVSNIDGLRRHLKIDHNFIKNSLIDLMDEYQIEHFHNTINHESEWYVPKSLKHTHTDPVNSPESHLSSMDKKSTRPQGIRPMRGVLKPQPANIGELLDHLNSEHFLNTSSLTSKDFEHIQSTHFWSHQTQQQIMHAHPFGKSSSLNWKERYANQDNDVNVDWNDPTSTAIHMIISHRGSFKFRNDEDRENHENDMLELSKSPEGRLQLKHLFHDHLHRRGFLMNSVNHNHPEESYEQPEWSTMSSEENE